MQNAAKYPEVMARLAEANGIPRERVLAILEAHATAFEGRTEQGRQNLAGNTVLPATETNFARRAARGLSSTAGIPLNIIDRCVRCGARAPPGEHFKACARCHTAVYCSKECQKADWRTHKKGCAEVTTPLPSQSSGTSADIEALLANPGGLSGHVDAINNEDMAHTPSRPIAASSAL